MHLAQHHFQVQSRYFEDSIAFALSHLFTGSYGLAGCELDADALRNGTVSLIHARGVMPDGLAFHFPDSDPVPHPRQIREVFSPTHDSHLVLLSIPPHRRGQSNCAPESDADNQDVRYLSATHRVPDETTGQDEKPVHVGRKNFRLILDRELDEAAVSLPLARVCRDGTGHFIYDSEYVPPCLQILASPRMLQLLKRLIEILEAKADAMARKQRTTRKSLVDYASQEVANFWLAHAIHSSVAPLRHHLQTKSSHPEQLYTELARLAGALCTFSLESHPRTLPLYDHDRLSECFDALDQHIRAHLDIIAPTNCVSVPLKPAREFLHTGVVTDQRCFGRSRWILGVRSSAADAEIISGVPRLIKICAARHILRLVKEAYAGLALEHLPTPPAAVSPRVGAQYFNIDRTGPCWEATVKTAEVGVYVPESFPDVELELLVVLES
jgi:type VI secretion system protein ImpJ